MSWGPEGVFGLQTGVVQPLGSTAIAQAQKGGAAEDFLVSLRRYGKL